MESIRQLLRLFLEGKVNTSVLVWQILFNINKQISKSTSVQFNPYLEAEPNLFGLCSYGILNE